MKNALKVRLSKLRKRFNPGKLSMRQLLLTTGFGDYQRDIEARAVKNVMFTNSLAEIQGSGIWTEKYPKKSVNELSDLILYESKNIVKNKDRVINVPANEQYSINFEEEKFKEERCTFLSTTNIVAIDYAREINAKAIEIEGKMIRIIF